MNQNSAFDVIWEREYTGWSCLLVTSLCHTTAFAVMKDARLERKHRNPKRCTTTGGPWVSFCGHVSTSSYQNVKSTSKGTTGVSRLLEVSIKWLCTSHVPGVGHPLLYCIHRSYNGLWSLWGQDRFSALLPEL